MGFDCIVIFILILNINNPTESPPKMDKQINISLLHPRNNFILERFHKNHKMARKKEQAVMETVSDEVEFVSFIDKPGLNVIDVYQTWCGPCKSIQGMTHRL